MARSIFVVVMCVGCEWGGGAGLTGRALPDASSALPPDAPHSVKDAAIDARVAGSDSGTSGTCSQPMASGVLATWAFAGQTGDQATTAAASMAPGSTAGAIGRSSDLVAASGADSINSSGWPTSATLDTTKGYYTFTITPPTDCSVSLTQASVQARASGTGPSTVVAGTSADAFAQMSALTVTATDSTSTPALSVNDATGSVEVRVFGYGATSTDGTFRIDGTLTLTGSFQ